MNKKNSWVCQGPQDVESRGINRGSLRRHDLRKNSTKKGTQKKPTLQTGGKRRENKNLLPNNAKHNTSKKTAESYDRALGW